MGREVLDTILGIVTAIVGLAIISVLLSKNANTVNVIKASGSALASDITAATAPITGGGFGGFQSFDTTGVTS